MKLSTYRSSCCPVGFSRDRKGRYVWLRIMRRVVQLEFSH